MRVFTLLLPLLLISPPTLAFKHLCNGMDADGAVEPDQCGVCTNETAARWLPSSVDVWVDLKTLPPHLSEAQWTQEATSALAAWNSIPGTAIDLRYAGHSEHRAFGIDTNLHEIFWVLSKDEWREKVGSGENGTLGVTVAPYQCPSLGRASREIYDADLIMNGTGRFRWRSDCQNQRNCEPINVTLIHELGHFIGIGHPCTDCDWSIMAAAGGNHMDAPLKDDRDAAIALYPSDQSGLFGMRCESDTECALGLQCIEQNNARFCSQKCTNACPQGFACDSGMCRFAVGRLAPPAGVHERCETKPCKDGLLCEETFSGNSFCIKSCLSNHDCPQKEQCILYADGGGGTCLEIAGLNEECGEFTTCSEKLICVGKHAATGDCKEECNSKKKRCRFGGVCTFIEEDVWACL